VFPVTGPVVAQTVGRAVALLFHEFGARMGVNDQQRAPAALYPQERPGSHFTGGWVDLSAGLDRRKISPSTGIRSPDRPNRGSLAIPTELPGPHKYTI
jgi:hypothetical protein